VHPLTPGTLPQSGRDVAIRCAGITHGLLHQIPCGGPVAGFFEDISGELEGNGLTVAWRCRCDFAAERGEPFTGWLLLVCLSVIFGVGGFNKIRWISTGSSASRFNVFLRKK
jgi:hypothetical protein